MAPQSRTFSGNIVESKMKQVHEQYHYQQHRQPPPQAIGNSGPQVERPQVPVLLCHTCSICGQMRSGGYHRHNPVVPGKPLVLTPCRRCKRRLKSQRRSVGSYTRIRSCTADDPCCWPRELVHIDIDHNEHRGRRRDREDVYMYRHSPSRPCIIRQGSSQTGFGLRVLQHDQSPTRTTRSATKVRLSSLSPPQGRTYDDVWPQPNIVHRKSCNYDEKRSAARPNPNVASRDEVWPPPDIVRTHSYKKATSSPPPSRRSRIIELSPSPPPARTRLTGVGYRSESLERRFQNVSPVRVSLGNEQRGQGAEARMTSHSQSYHPVSSDHHGFSRVPRKTSDNKDVSHERQESPNPGILKPPGGEHETARRRMGIRESQQSTAVEVGTPRVRFSSQRCESRPVMGGPDKPRYEDHGRRSIEDHKVYRDYSRHRYVNEPPLSPPIEEMERLRVQRPLLSPLPNYEEEIRIDRARRLSPSPPRRPKVIRHRHASPLPPGRESEREPYPTPLPLAAERLANSGYRHVSRTKLRSRSCSRSHSLSPPPIRKPSSEDMTDSESEYSGNVIQARRWRGIDENGQPAIFVEEKDAKLIEQGSERGGLVSEIRPLNAREVGRDWRDV
ncbi:hypothetical protein GQ44DRAFT_696541 [Phaeosphaeriaceae sp. PMI808]|nr:hypothetical protein GQ44DRAFT_696541 [Phaeosphaeriaceae sp. PMI808]